MSNNRQIRVAAFGVPTEVAQVETAPVLKPGAGEILVRTAFAPINPADVNVLEGRYGKLPDLPATIGNEGAGTIEAVGEGVEGLATGDQVLYLDRGDCWQDYVLAKADQVLRVPKGLDPQLACMLKINPLTALLLLLAAGQPEPGAWIVQNASNSGVGRAVIAIAKAKGWRTVNFVRREELVAPLTEAGGDVVVLDDDSGREKALEAIGGDPIGLALNAVGGESALRIMSMLSPGGTHVTYGAMGLRPLKIPNSFLIFRGLNIRGLWVSKWLEATPRAEIEAAYAELAELMIGGALPQPVDSTFSPEQVGEALARAMQGGRDGKVLLDFTSAPTEGN